MASGLYGIATSALWVAATPWIAWRRSRAGRQWRERLGELPRRDDHPVWVHAASVGEVAAADPIVREIVSRGASVLLTTMTPTGQRAAGDRLGDVARTAFVPLDFVPAVRRALELTRPRSLVLVESELWPNLIEETSSAGVPVGLVNGRMSRRKAARAKWPFSPLRDALLSLTIVACRDRDDADGFEWLGITEERLVVSGDAKYDMLPGPLPEAERKALRASLGVRSDGSCVVFGSVRPREEPHVVRAVAGLSGGVRVVLAPRHMRRVAPIKRALERVGVPVFQRTDASPPSGRGTVVVDTTGELARLYGAADVAFVGGTLGGYGGHNPLEPASRGVPVLLGPDTRNCESAARALVDRGGAVRVGSGRELGSVIVRLLSDDARRTAAGEAALDVVETGRGAAARTVDALDDAGLLESRR